MIYLMNRAKFVAVGRILMIFNIKELIYENWLTIGSLSSHMWNQVSRPAFKVRILKPMHMRAIEFFHGINTTKSVQQCNNAITEAV